MFGWPPSAIATSLPESPPPRAGEVEATNPLVPNPNRQRRSDTKLDSISHITFTAALAAVDRNAHLNEDDAENEPQEQKPSMHLAVPAPIASLPPIPSPRNGTDDPFLDNDDGDEYYDDEEGSGTYESYHSSADKSNTHNNLSYFKERHVDGEEEEEDYEEGYEYTEDRTISAGDNIKTAISSSGSVVSINPSLGMVHSVNPPASLPKPTLLSSSDFGAATPIGRDRGSPKEHLVFSSTARGDIHMHPLSPNSDIGLNVNDGSPDFRAPSTDTEYSPHSGRFNRTASYNATATASRLGASQSYNQKKRRESLNNTRSLIEEESLYALVDEEDDEENGEYDDDEMSKTGGDDDDISPVEEEDEEGGEGSSRLNGTYYSDPNASVLAGEAEDEDEEIDEHPFTPDNQPLPKFTPLQLSAHLSFRHCCERFDVRARDWNEEFQVLWEAECRPQWDFSRKRRLQTLFSDFEELAANLTRKLVDEVPQSGIVPVKDVARTLLQQQHAGALMRNKSVDTTSRRDGSLHSTAKGSIFGRSLLLASMNKSGAATDRLSIISNSVEALSSVASTTDELHQAVLANDLQGVLMALDGMNPDTLSPFTSLTQLRRWMTRAHRFATVLEEHRRQQQWQADGAQRGPSFSTTLMSPERSFNTSLRGEGVSTPLHARLPAGAVPDSSSDALAMMPEPSAFYMMGGSPFTELHVGTTGLVDEVRSPHEEQLIITRPPEYSGDLLVPPMAQKEEHKLWRTSTLSETNKSTTIDVSSPLNSMGEILPQALGRGAKITMHVSANEGSVVEPQNAFKRFNSKVSFARRPRDSSHTHKVPKSLAGSRMGSTGPQHASKANLAALAAASPYAHRCFRYGNVFLQRWLSPEEVAVARSLQLATKAMLESRAPCLSFPLMSMFTYRGVVVTAHALIPFGKSCKRVYRGDLRPDFLVTSNDLGQSKPAAATASAAEAKPEDMPGVPATLVHQFVRRLAESVNLLPVDVGQRQLKVGCVEVVEGPDTRLYVTNPIGLLPPLFTDDPAYSPKRRLEHVVLSRNLQPFMWCPSNRVEQSCYFIVQLLPKLAKNILFSEEAVNQATAAHNAVIERDGGPVGGAADGGRRKVHQNHLKYYLGPVGIYNLMQDQLVQLLHSFGLNVCLLGAVLLVLLQERELCRLKTKKARGEGEGQDSPTNERKTPSPTNLTSFHDLSLDVDQELVITSKHVRQARDAAVESIVASDADDTDVLDAVVTSIIIEMISRTAKSFLYRELHRHVILGAPRKGSVSPGKDQLTTSTLVGGGSPLGGGVLLQQGSSGGFSASTSPALASIRVPLSRGDTFTKGLMSQQNGGFARTLTPTATSSPLLRTLSSGGGSDVDVYNGFFDSYSRRGPGPFGGAGDNFSAVSNALLKPRDVCYNNDNVQHVFMRLLGALFEAPPVRPMTLSINDRKMATFRHEVSSGNDTDMTTFDNNTSFTKPSALTMKLGGELAKRKVSIALDPEQERRQSKEISGADFGVGKAANRGGSIGGKPLETIASIINAASAFANVRRRMSSIGAASHRSDGPKDSFANSSMFEGLGNRLATFRHLNRSVANSEHAQVSKFKTIFLPAMAEKFNFDLEADSFLVSEIMKCVGGGSTNEADTLLDEMSTATSGEASSALLDVEEASLVDSSLNLSEMSKKPAGGGVRIRILRRLVDLCGVTLSKGSVERVAVLSSQNNLTGVYQAMGRTEYFSHVEDVDRDDDFSIEYVVSRRMPLRAHYMCRKNEMELGLTELRKALHTRKVLDGNKSFLYLDGMLQVGILILEAALVLQNDETNNKRRADTSPRKQHRLSVATTAVSAGGAGDEWDAVNEDEVVSLQLSEYFEVAMSLFARAIREMFEASNSDHAAVSAFIAQINRRAATINLVRNATTVDLTGGEASAVGRVRPAPSATSVIRTFFGSTLTDSANAASSGVAQKMLSSKTGGKLPPQQQQIQPVDPAAFVPLYYSKQIINVKLLQGKLRLAQNNLEEAKMYFDEASLDVRMLPTITQVAGSDIVLRTIDAHVDLMTRVIEVGGILTCTGDASSTVLSVGVNRGMLDATPTNQTRRRSTTFADAFKSPTNGLFSANVLLTSEDSTLRSASVTEVTPTISFDVKAILNQTHSAMLRLKPSIFTHALLERLCSVLISTAATDETADIVRELVDQSRTIFGSTSIELATALNLLAFVYAKINMEEFGEECETVMEESMSIIEEVHGLFSVEHLTAINNFGTMLISRQKYMQASRLFNQALLATIPKDSSSTQGGALVDHLGEGGASSPLKGTKAAAAAAAEVSAGLSIEESLLSPQFMGSAASVQRAVLGGLPYGRQPEAQSKSAIVGPDHPIVRSLRANVETLKEYYRSEAVLVIQIAWRSYRSMRRAAFSIDMATVALQRVGRGYLRRRDPLRRAPREVFHHIFGASAPLLAVSHAPDYSARDWTGELNAALGTVPFAGFRAESAAKREQRYMHIIEEFSEDFRTHVENVIERTPMQAVRLEGVDSQRSFRHGNMVITRWGGTFLRRNAHGGSNGTGGSSEGTYSAKSEPRAFNYSDIPQYVSGLDSNASRSSDPASILFAHAPISPPMHQPHHGDFVLDTEVFTLNSDEEQEHYPALMVEIARCILEANIPFLQVPLVAVMRGSLTGMVYTAQSAIPLGPTTVYSFRDDGVAVHSATSTVFGRDSKMTNSVIGGPLEEFSSSASLGGSTPSSTCTDAPHPRLSRETPFINCDNRTSLVHAAILQLHNYLSHTAIARHGMINLDAKDHPASVIQAGLTPKVEPLPHVVHKHFQPSSRQQFNAHDSLSTPKLTRKSKNKSEARNHIQVAQKERSHKPRKERTISRSRSRNASEDDEGYSSLGTYPRIVHHKKTRPTSRASRRSRRGSLSDSQDEVIINNTIDMTSATTRMSSPISGRLNTSSRGKNRYTDVSSVASSCSTEDRFLEDIAQGYDLDDDVDFGLGDMFLSEPSIGSGDTSLNTTQQSQQGIQGLLFGRASMESNPTASGTNDDLANTVSFKNHSPGYPSLAAPANNGTESSPNQPQQPSLSVRQQARLMKRLQRHRDAIKRLVRQQQKDHITRQTEMGRLFGIEVVHGADERYYITNWFGFMPGLWRPAGYSGDALMLTLRNVISAPHVPVLGGGTGSSMQHGAGSLRRSHRSALAPRPASFSSQAGGVGGRFSTSNSIGGHMSSNYPASFIIQPHTQSTSSNPKSTMLSIASTLSLSVDTSPVGVVGAPKLGIAQSSLATLTHVASHPELLFFNSRTKKKIVGFGGDEATSQREERLVGSGVAALSGSGHSPDLYSMLRLMRASGSGQMMQIDSVNGRLSGGSHNAPGVGSERGSLISPGRSRYSPQQISLTSAADIKGDALKHTHMTTAAKGREHRLIPAFVSPLLQTNANSIVPAFMGASVNMGGGAGGYLRLRDEHVQSLGAVTNDITHRMSLLIAGDASGVPGGPRTSVPTGGKAAPKQQSPPSRHPSSVFGSGFAHKRNRFHPTARGTSASKQECESYENPYLTYYTRARLLCQEALFADATQLCEDVLVHLSRHLDQKTMPGREDLTSVLAVPLIQRASITSSSSSRDLNPHDGRTPPRRPSLVGLGGSDPLTNLPRRDTEIQRARRSLSSSAGQSVRSTVEEVQDDLQSSSIHEKPVDNKYSGMLFSVQGMFAYIFALYTLAHVHLAAKKPAQALPLVRQIIRVFNTVGASLNGSILFLLNSVGLACIEQHAVDSARQAFADALIVSRLHQRVLLSNAFHGANDLMMLPYVGLINCDAAGGGGVPIAAQELLKSLRYIARHSTQTDRLALFLTDSANHFLKKGAYPLAAELAAEATRVVCNIHGVESLHHVKSLVTESQVFFNWNVVVFASSCQQPLEKAIEILLRIAPQTQLLGSVRNNLGCLFMQLRYYGKAHLQFSLAEDIFKKIPMNKDNMTEIQKIRKNMRTLDAKIMLGCIIRIQAWVRGWRQRKKREEELRMKDPVAFAAFQEERLRSYVTQIEFSERRDRLAAMSEEDTAFIYIMRRHNRERLMTKSAAVIRRDALQKSEEALLRRRKALEDGVWQSRLSEVAEPHGRLKLAILESFAWFGRYPGKIGGRALALLSDDESIHRQLIIKERSLSIQSGSWLVPAGATSADVAVAVSHHLEATRLAARRKVIESNIAPLYVRLVGMLEFLNRSHIEQLYERSWKMDLLPEVSFRLAQVAQSSQHNSALTQISQALQGVVARNAVEFEAETDERAVILHQESAERHQLLEVYSSTSVALEKKRVETAAARERQTLFGFEAMVRRDVVATEEQLREANIVVPFKKQRDWKVARRLKKEREIVDEEENTSRHTVINLEKRLFVLLFLDYVAATNDAITQDEKRRGVPQSRPTPPKPSRRASVLMTSIGESVDTLDGRQSFSESLTRRPPTHQRRPSVSVTQLNSMVRGSRTSESTDNSLPSGPTSGRNSAFVPFTFPVSPGSEPITALPEKRDVSPVSGNLLPSSRTSSRNSPRSPLPNHTPDVDGFFVPGFAAFSAQPTPEAAQEKESPPSANTVGRKLSLLRRSFSTIPVPPTAAPHFDATGKGGEAFVSRSVSASSDNQSELQPDVRQDTTTLPPAEEQQEEECAAPLIAVLNSPSDDDQKRPSSDTRPSRVVPSLNAAFLESASPSPTGHLVGIAGARISPRGSDTALLGRSSNTPSIGPQPPHHSTTMFPDGQLLTATSVTNTDSEGSVRHTNDSSILITTGGGVGDRSPRGSVSIRRPVVRTSVVGTTFMESGARERSDSPMPNQPEAAAMILPKAKSAAKDEVIVSESAPGEPTSKKKSEEMFVETPNKEEPQHHHHDTAPSSVAVFQHTLSRPAAVNAPSEKKSLIADPSAPMNAEERSSVPRPKISIADGKTTKTSVFAISSSPRPTTMEELAPSKESLLFCRQEDTRHPEISDVLTSKSSRVAATAATPRGPLTLDQCAAVYPMSLDHFLQPISTHTANKTSSKPNKPSKPTTVNGAGQPNPDLPWFLRRKPQLKFEDVFGPSVPDPLPASHPLGGVSASQEPPVLSDATASSTSNTITLRSSVPRNNHNNDNNVIHAVVMKKPQSMQLEDSERLYDARRCDEVESSHMLLLELISQSRSPPTTATTAASNIGFKLDVSKDGGENPAVPSDGHKDKKKKKKKRGDRGGSAVAQSEGLLQEADNETPTLTHPVIANTSPPSLEMHRPSPESPQRTVAESRETIHTSFGGTGSSGGEQRASILQVDPTFTTLDAAVAAQPTLTLSRMYSAQYGPEQDGPDVPTPVNPSGAVIRYGVAVEPKARGRRKVVTQEVAISNQSTQPVGGWFQTPAPPQRPPPSASNATPNPRSNRTIEIAGLGIALTRSPPRNHGTDTQPTHGHDTINTSDFTMAATTSSSPTRHNASWAVSDASEIVSVIPPGSDVVGGDVVVVPQPTSRPLTATTQQQQQSRQRGRRPITATASGRPRVVAPMVGEYELYRRSPHPPQPSAVTSQGRIVPLPPPSIAAPPHSPHDENNDSFHHSLATTLGSTKNSSHSRLSRTNPTGLNNARVDVPVLDQVNSPYPRRRPLSNDSFDSTAETQQARFSRLTNEAAFSASRNSDSTLTPSSSPSSSSM